MRIATIDIGTNTILMLVAEMDPGGGMRVLDDRQVVARVGKGVDRSGTIAWDAFTRSEQFLASYLLDARQAGVDVIRCTGTSALRDARNGDDYLEYMFSKLGLEIEILSGEEEALWTYGGAISGFSDRNAPYAVLDIGGGSTELTVGHGFRIDERRSLDIGCVRLTEKFLHHTPPTEDELARLIAVIDEAIPRFPAFEPSTTMLVGVAGTVTTLAAVDVGLDQYDRQRIAGHVLTREHIRQRFEQFSRMSKDELHERLRIDPGRADIILVGVAILERLTALRGIPRIVVSERGLRYGIALREWERLLEGA